MGFGRRLGMLVNNIKSRGMELTLGMPLCAAIDFGEYTIGGM